MRARIGHRLVVATLICLVAALAVAETVRATGYVKKTQGDADYDFLIDVLEFEPVSEESDS